MGLILSRTETLMANALDLFHALLQRLCKRLYNGQQPQTLYDSSSCSPNLQGKVHIKSKLHPPSSKLPVAEISVATIFNAHSAFHRADSSKLVTPSADEVTMAVSTSPRPRTTKGRLKCSTEPERSALMPFVKLKPGTYKSALPPDDIAQQGNARRSGSARTSRRVERTAPSESSFGTLTPRLKYQRHIKELEKHRMILQRLKREYSRARADYERSENALQCLRRQGQETLQDWRKHKHSAEGSLRKMARKLRNGRLLENQMMMKVWKTP